MKSSCNPPFDRHASSVAACMCIGCVVCKQVSDVISTVSERITRGRGYIDALTIQSKVEACTCVELRHDGAYVVVTYGNGSTRVLEAPLSDISYVRGIIRVRCYEFVMNVGHNKEYRKRRHFFDDSIDDDSEGEPSCGLRCLDTQFDVREAITALPKDIQDVVKLRFMEAHTRAEVAERLGKGPGWVEYNEEKAMKLLQRALCAYAA